MKKILFLSGTRADYGKIKALIQAVEKSENFEAYIYVSGMHLLKKYGSTYREILKDNYKNVYVAHGLYLTNDMSFNIGNLICNFQGYVKNIEPDMIVVHGDRIDALAGAIVGALNNIVVAHIEGGELSGTIDESIRHTISKLSHLHLVCNDEAKKRLLQMGEEEKRIHILGSPDVDFMLSDKLPSIEEAKKRYEINFDKYAILMYHPVTTEYDSVRKHIQQVVDAIIESGKNFIVVYPNNDHGTEFIEEEYKRFFEKDNAERFRMFPSVRFEHFLTFMKNADFIIGNSSAGIHESCVYGLPTIDIGTRQKGRWTYENFPNLQHTNENKDEILNAISKVDGFRKKSSMFGDGKSTERFMEILNGNLWNLPIQKVFVDMDF